MAVRKVYLCLFVCISTVVVEAASPKHYKVTTLPAPPYISVVPDKKSSRFEGILVDVLDELSRRMTFTYEMTLVDDGKYGWETKPGLWNGLIGSLVNKTADIAAAPLTIASKRAEVVKYSQPYMTAGLKILYRQPAGWTNNAPIMLLLRPFTPGLWVVIILFFAGVSVLFFIIGRFSPFEDDQFVGKAATYEGLTLFNSFLYTFSSLTWQGYTAAPRSLSGRVLAATWWVFCMLTIVTFTANLTALFLTREPNFRSMPFMTFEELSKQTSVKYGTYSKGSTYNYFKKSNRTLEKRLFAAMNSATPSAFFDTFDKGIQRVRESDGGYAMIAEGPVAEMAAEQEPCDLVVVGDTLTEHAYGFACQLNSTVCDEFNQHLLEMRENDFIYETKQKWMYSGCNEKRNKELFFHGLAFLDAFGAKPDVEMQTAVTLRTFGAALILLVLGCVFSIVIMVVEVFYARRRGLQFPSRSRMPNQQRIEEPFEDDK
ncbi:glutamate receptor ionotropic, kainate 3-like [Gigantopelta aegis]|uniref:glutamate receptor ionotropic, kainate 3-like n=1 Tax=Gigantopelta aegis TaxID=1735272 RepID=UPI001B88B3FC|nr:glutamate receptor ionotropic, kainate 3-like [Gigantopelta aegis]